MFFYQRYVVSVLSNIWYICTLSHEIAFMIQSCQRVPSLCILVTSAHIQIRLQSID